MLASVDFRTMSIHGLDFRGDGYQPNTKPSTFELFRIEPVLQYRFGEHWVGAAGVLFTVAGQNNIDAIYPNFSLYYLLLRPKRRGDDALTNRCQ
jgi:hypothetical protein